MHFAKLAPLLLVALAGCADAYYRMIGESEWPHEDHSLYTRLGGTPGINTLVDGLVLDIAADPRLNVRFAGTDVPRLKILVVQQICADSGGPCVYTGRGMRDVHASMAIDNPTFDAFMEDVRLSLAKSSVAPEDQQNLLDRLGTLRKDIVTVGDSTQPTAMP